MPDEVTNGIVKERLAQEDIKETGFLLDGYPRTIDQLMLDQILADLGIQLDAVINIGKSDSLLERLSGRIITRNRGNLPQVFQPTSGLQKKKTTTNFEDDKPETVKRRLDIQYRSRTTIIEHLPRPRTGPRYSGESRDLGFVFSDIEKVLSKFEIKRFPACNI